MPQIYENFRHTSGIMLLLDSYFCKSHSFSFSYHFGRFQREVSCFHRSEVDGRIGLFLIFENSPWATIRFTAFASVPTDSS